MTLEKLNLTDLGRCRRVSRRFRAICEIVRIEELIICPTTYDPKTLWFYTNKSIDYRGSVKFETFCKHSLNLFRLTRSTQTFFSPLSRLLSTLKYIHFGSFDNSDRLDFNFSLLNPFTRLEQLDVGCQIVGDHQVLSPPNLRIIKFEFLDRSSFLFKTPKLEVLSLPNLKSTSFHQPETLRHLVIGIYGKAIKSFINLEVLVLDSISTLDRNVLAVFRKLKQLYLYPELLGLRGGAYAQFKDKINYIFNQKIILKRNDFAIYWLNVRLENLAKFEEYDFNQSNELQFQISNYDLLNGDLARFHEIDYTVLMNSINQIPDDFFSKFIQIESVRVASKINDPNQFLVFLKNLQYLYSLDLMNTSLGSSFYNNLPAILDCQLSDLLIHETDNLKLNFKFILKLKFLVRFRTNQQFTNSFDLATKCFPILKYLWLFEFKFNGNYFSICSLDDRNFRIKAYQGKWPNRQVVISKNNMKMEDLITYCNHLRSLSNVQTSRTTRSKSKFMNSINENKSG